MALELESSGRYLLNDDGDAVGVKHSDACVARAVALAFGTAFQSGIGTGEIRNALKLGEGGHFIVSALAQEENAEVIAYYDAAYPDDAGNVTLGTVADTLDSQLNPIGDPPPAWTMAIFDFCLQDLSIDKELVDIIKALWPDVGGRVVVLAERGDLTLDGFASLAPELIDGTYIYIFDRFDPTNGI